MAAKRLDKGTIAAIIIVLALLVSFSVLLPIYLNYNKSYRELYQNSEIRIVAYGSELGVYTLDDLLALEGVSEEDFSAIYDTSNSEPTQKTYTGLELKTVLLALDIDLESARTVIFKASDGMNKIYSQQEVAANNNVYIAYKVNGRLFNKGIDPLGYTKKAEDGGPFVAIKVSDVYSQNRCKLMAEIEIK